MWLYVPPPSSPSAPDTAGWSSASALLSLEFVVWVLSSGKPSPQRSSQVEWSKVPWIHVLSMTIWNPSMAERTATAWISSLPVSPARAPASQESDSASSTNAGSGRKSGASRKKRTPAGSSVRTSPVSSLLTVGEHSRTSSGTWHRAGGMRSGTVSPRQPSEPRTSAIVSSCLLPTPAASEYGSSQNGINGVGGEHERPSAGRPSLGTAARTGMIPTPRASDATKGGRSVPTRAGREGVTLVEAANMGMPPTPVARDHKGVGRDGQLPTLLLTPTTRPNNHRSGHKRHNEDDPGRTLLTEVRTLLPTPTAGDAKASGVAANRTPDSGRHSGATLTDVVVRGIDIPTSPEFMTSGESTGSGATRLNPAFVAWMMGLPVGWATIRPMPRPSTYSATVSSRTRRRRPSSPSSSDSTQLSLVIPPPEPLATGK